MARLAAIAGEAAAMAMTAAQINAFKTVSGNIDISVLYLVSVGQRLCVLFLWAA